MPGRDEGGVGAKFGGVGEPFSTEFYRVPPPFLRSQLKMELSQGVHEVPRPNCGLFCE